MEVSYGAKRHFEQKEDEVFLGNLTRETFERIEWKTKRMGNLRFDGETGELVVHSRELPVFVSRKEAEESQVPIDDLDMVVW